MMEVLCICLAVIKELPTPSESEMMELRQFVVRNTIKDFRERF